MLGKLNRQLRGRIFPNHPQELPIADFCLKTCKHIPDYNCGNTVQSTRVTEQAHPTQLYHFTDCYSLQLRNRK